MSDEKFEASCLHCKHWEERKDSNQKNSPKHREGVCNGKYEGDFVTGNQYCLGFLRK